MLLLIKLIILNLIIQILIKLLSGHIFATHYPSANTNYYLHFVHLIALEHSKQLFIVVQALQVKVVSSEKEPKFSIYIQYTIKFININFSI